MHGGMGMAAGSGYPGTTATTLAARPPGYNAQPAGYGAQPAGYGAQPAGYAQQPGMGNNGAPRPAGAFPPPLQQPAGSLPPLQQPTGAYPPPPPMPTVPPPAYGPATGTGATAPSSNQLYG